MKIFPKTVVVDEGGNGDYTNIKSALDALDDSTDPKGGVVIVEQGEYVLSSSSDALEIPSNVALIGRGNVVIKVNGDFTAVTNRKGWDGDTRIVFSGFKIVAKDSGVNAHLMDFKNVTHSLIENIYIDGKSPKEGKAGILFRGSTTPEGFSYGNRISKCTVCNCGYGIFLSTNAVRNFVEGCNLFYNHTNLYLINAPRNDVIGNICHSSAGSSGANGHDGILIDHCESCVIEGNICDNNVEHGIYVSTGSKGCVVRGNICRNNDYCGIQLNGGSGAEVAYNVIVGNSCYQNQNTTTSHGIYIGYYAKRNVVDSNNCFDNGGYGIREADRYYGNEDRETQRNVIVGNVCYENNQGQILLGEGTNSLAANNGTE